MPISKECETYLQSTEVIKILKSHNSTYESRILNCITLHRDMVCGGVTVAHRLIGNDVLQMCVQDAFMMSKMIFVKNVKEDKYSADTDYCLPYIKSIFRKLYFHMYQKELERKMKLNQMDDTEYEPENKHLSQLQTVVNTIVQTLNSEDRKMYEMRYVQGMKVKEMAEELGLKAQTVSTKLLRLHNHFSSKWNFNLN